MLMARAQPSLRYREPSQLVLATIAEGLRVANTCATGMISLHGASSKRGASRRATYSLWNLESETSEKIFTSSWAYSVSVLRNTGRDSETIVLRAPTIHASMAVHTGSGPSPLFWIAFEIYLTYLASFSRSASSSGNLLKNSRSRS